MKIKCIGFSVTGYGELPYSVILKEKLLDLGIGAEITYASVGGLSIDALCYLLDLMIGADQDELIVLEIATSWFSIMRKNQEDADIFMRRIVEYFECKGKNVVFLNLYRKDISDQDLVVNAIYKYKNNYPVLDLKSKYRERLIKGESDGTTDGVHPTQKTIEEIAVDLARFIQKNNFDINKTSLKIVDFSDYKIILPLIEGGLSYHFDNRHGLLMNGFKISNIANFNFKFESPVSISGILFVYGPDTNSLSIKIGNEIIEVQMYDKMSFYRRLGYKYFGKRLVTNIDMIFNYSKPDIILDRVPWERFEKRSCYFMGFTS